MYKYNETVETSENANTTIHNPDIDDTIKKTEEIPPKPTPNNTSKHKNNIIIIKKVKRRNHNKHHGGSWKIAYADFVTAMMTFFLLLWLLSMLNKYQLEGISVYFKKPLKEALQTESKLDKVKTKQEEKMNQLSQPKTAAEIEEERKKEIEGRMESEKMKNELEKQLKSDPKISQYQNSLNFVVTSQGLKIELKDLENKTMFSSGKTDFANYAQTILSWLGNALNKYPNRVMIIGHTDSKPYGDGKGYSNWELSADRANATRRELIKNNMDVAKIVRIVGAGSTDKLDTTSDDSDPANRRISIIILTDDAFNKMQESQ